MWTKNKENGAKLCGLRSNSLPPQLVHYSLKILEIISTEVEKTHTFLHKQEGLEHSFIQ